MGTSKITMFAISLAILGSLFYTASYEAAGDTSLAASLILTSWLVYKAFKET